MPHIELKYCIEIDLNPDVVLSGIESLLKEYDHEVGLFKSRSYHYDTLSPHVLLELSLKKRPYRDDKYLNGLLMAIEKQLQSSLPESTQFSIEIKFLSPYYLSGQSKSE